MLELKNTFDFSQVTLSKPIQCKTSWILPEAMVIAKTNDIKQHPCFYQISPQLVNIILNENKIDQRKKEKRFFSTLCHHTFENPFAFPDHLPLSLFSPQLKPRHHNIDNFLRYCIIINVFSMKQVMPKPPFTQTLSYFFLINSLKSISIFKIKIFNETWYI